MCLEPQVVGTLTQLHTKCRYGSKWFHGTLCCVLVHSKQQIEMLALLALHARSAVMQTQNTQGQAAACLMFPLTNPGLMRSR